jgi:tRNA/rRNA methyltransferase
LPFLRELDRLRVVLVSTRNPLNIGAAARAMSNFGCSHLRVVNPYERAFREARSAVGGADVLANAEEFTSVADAVADCTLVVGTTAVRHRDLQHSLRRLEPAARAIRKHLAASPVAILFGSEKFGLSNEDLSHCHWLLNIPTSEKNISLNLGQAVAVCLYELIRDQKVSRQSEKVNLAKSAELERITTLLLEVLRASGYIDLRRVADVDERIRRLVRRLKLPARDSELWLGMMRQILWKIKSGERSPK